jgi:hypothetical protein
MLGFLGHEGASSMLIWKSEAESSKNQRSFICRKAKGKATWGGGMQWDPETGSPLSQVGHLVL